MSVLFTISINAQVKIGDVTTPPNIFSILEIVASPAKYGGLRLPQLSSSDLITLEQKFNVDTETAKAAEGLVIFNTTTNCLEFWNGSTWVSLCSSVFSAFGVSITPTFGEVQVGNTVQLTASINGGTSPYNFTWEVSFDGTSWSTLEGVTMNPFNAPAVWVGVTYYRVTVKDNNNIIAVSNVAAITGSGTEPTPPAYFTPYVGAFWKHDQTGERLIRNVRPYENTSVDGAWTATVIAGNSWIKLDKVMTSDPNVGWKTGANEASVINGNDGGFESNPNYQVTGNAKTVTGTLSSSDTTIYFRIGLNGPHTPTSGNPARYGVILLTYKNNTLSQRIYIRQGEEEDYLMKPEEYGGNGQTWGSPEPRPDAQKFAPYNLTADNSFYPTGWPSGVPGVQLTIHGGIFTDYPSQAGAFFQWANTSNHTRYAWDPITPTIVSPNTWDYNYPNDMWGNLYGTHETCPPGYRRPNDGDITAVNTGNVEDSEIRQSMWVNPVPGYNVPPDNPNTLWGYYADGFFDRREITNSPGISPGVVGAVSVSNEKVAYIGCLFYNPNNNNSLFFPAAGTRTDTGDLNGTGSTGYYMTSSVAHVDANNINWNISTLGMFNFSSIGNHGKAMIDIGYSVRCVKDQNPSEYCEPISGVSIDSSEGLSIETETSTTLSANFSPIGATEVSFEWQSYSASLDMWLPMEVNSSVCEVDIMTIGENKFCVIVSNGCTESVISDTITITRTSPPDPEVGGGSAARITWDPVKEQYSITYDPRDAGLYFKFGSVVGIFSDHGKNYDMTATYPNGYYDDFHAVDVAWAPHGDPNELYPDFFPPELNFADVPGFFQASHAGSKVDYEYHHTIGGVKDGFGDPCRLVGLDLNKIKNTEAYSLEDSDIDNFMWRMPTSEENQDFVGGEGDNQWDHVTAPFWWGEGNHGNISYGVPGAEFPSRNTGGIFKFLPAAGMRGEDYAGEGNGYGTFGQKEQGHYFANKKFDAERSYILLFTEHKLGVEEISDNIALMNTAMPIRCVYDPQVVPTLDLSPKELIFGPSSTILSADVFSSEGWYVDDKDFHSGGNWFQSVSPDTGGDGKTVVDVHVIANPNNEIRNANIIIKSGDLTKEIYVEQFGVDGQGSIDRITVEGTGEDAKLVITRNEHDPGLFFKWGSVIGLEGTPGSYNQSQVVFNPTNSNFSTWGSIPYHNTAHPVTIPTHDWANIRNGIGDACRTIGMTVNQIKTLSDQELDVLALELKASGVGGWKMPTHIQDLYFANYNGFPFSWENNFHGEICAYWSDETANEENSFSLLNIDGSGFYASGAMTERISTAINIRCVRED